MTFVLKTYAVRVQGFLAEHTYLGRTPAQARVKAWHAYCSFRHVPFREFLRISSIKRAGDAPGLGHEITVGGLPAHWCGYDGQYVRFTRPGGDLVLSSHPLDVIDAEGAA